MPTTPAPSTTTSKSPAGSTAVLKSEGAGRAFISGPPQGARLRDPLGPLCHRPESFIDADQPAIDLHRRRERDAPLSRVSNPRAVRLPESFRGGCSFGASPIVPIARRIGLVSPARYDDVRIRPAPVKLVEIPGDALLTSR